MEKGSTRIGEEEEEKKRKKVDQAFLSLPKLSS